MKLTPDRNQMLQFKKYIHGSRPTLYQLFSKNAQLSKSSKIMDGKLTKGRKEQLAAANSNGMNVTMMINEGTTRKSNSITKINALFCDFDRRVTKKELLALPVRPHLIINTSPGKYHVYWRVIDCPVESYTHAMKALSIKLDSDTSVSDLSRVMRMPGTYNHKYSPPFLVGIVHQDEDASPMAFEDFCSKMGLVISTPIATPRRSAGKQPPLSQEKRAEIENALARISPENRDRWLRIGMAIHSADPSDAGRNLWIKWAKQSAKFDKAEHFKIWNKFRPDGGVTVDTLFWMANLVARGEQIGYDEDTLAKLFAENFRGKLRYCPEIKKWLQFNGVVWNEANPQVPQGAAREMVLNLAAVIDDPAATKALSRYKTIAGYRSITSHAELLPELQADVAAFDKNPNLLALKNGVVDLRTGLFRQATPDDLLRRQANVEYDTDARAPEWSKFLRQVTCEDKQLYLYIRRVIGYILFGCADLQLFFLIIGSGGNGKGVLMRTLKSILSDYATTVPPNLLSTAYSGNANAPSPALAKLNGARYVICTELRPGRLDEAFIKQFSGGDEITARHTYGDVFTFKPEGKLVVSANHNDLPEIAADDEAMWRRLIPIPFNAKFVKGENDDVKLEEKLTAEFSGILNWMLKGASSYHKAGLKSCAAVEQAKDRLRKESDSLLSWMSECCVVKTSLKTVASVAYESYVVFMDHKGKKPITVQAFKAGLSRKGFHHKQTSKHNVYVGFGLR